jgi:hypothetical protein
MLKKYTFSVTMPPILVKIFDENKPDSLLLYIIYDKEKGIIAIDGDQKTHSDLEQTKPHLNQGQYAFLNSVILTSFIYNVIKKSKFFQRLDSG